MGQTTIKDIANWLNLSASTVSRALRNHPDISSETKVRVTKMAEQLDYQLNTVAQSLRQRKTKMIGVIVPEIKHHFFSNAISGIEDVAYNNGYYITVCQSNESYEREVVNVRALVSNRVAGLLASISENTVDSSHFNLLIKIKTPLVFFDRYCDDVKATKVIVDDYEGASKATENLIQSGYNRIAYLAGPKHLSISRERFRGYRAALKHYGIPFRDELVVYGGMKEEDGELGFQKLFQLNPLPDAIFAVNDPVAIGVFKQIRKRDLKIPDDMALFGFSNNPISALIEPALSTVDQSAYDLGKIAAGCLIEQIESDQEYFEPKTEVLKTRLIIRDST